MSAFLTVLPSDFLDHFLAGMALNFEIAFAALMIGLLFGAPLALGTVTRLAPVRWLTAIVVLILRAVPTFVVMFFLFNVLPRDVTLGDITVPLAPQTIVALSLVPYSASYLSENGSEAVRQWRAGSVLAALLFLPNVARAYFVLVMSTGAGAAIGVTEGISVILRQAERMPSLSDRLYLFAFGVLLFGLTLQVGFILVMGLRRLLTNLALRSARIPQPMRGTDHV